MAEEIMSGAVAESAAGAESTAGNDTNAQNTEGAEERDEFLSGLLGEDEGFSFEEKTEEEPENKENADEAMQQSATPHQSAEPTASPQGEAESKPVTTFVEHGKSYEVSTKALEEFAAGVGLSPEAVIERFQKGSGFDAQQQRLAAAEADAKMIRELADISGKDPATLLKDVREMNYNFALKGKVAELSQKYPGSTPEMINALAEAQLKAEQADKQNAESVAAGKAKAAEAKAKYDEIGDFLINHPEFKNQNVDPSVLEAFKAGVPLESAFQHWQQQKEQADKIAELEQQLATEKENVKKAEQKAFNRTNTPGSASGLGKGAQVDDFVAGLFGDY